MKTYEFNGNKFRLKDLTLGVLNAASPLLASCRQEFYRLTEDTDTSHLDELLGEIDLLGETLKSAEEENQPEKNIIKLSSRLEELKKKLKKAPYSAQQKFLKEMESIALLNVLTDTELLSGILNGILVNIDGENFRISDKQLNGTDSIEFIKQVIADFFLLIQSSSLLLKV